MQSTEKRSLSFLEFFGNCFYVSLLLIFGFDG